MIIPSGMDEHRVANNSRFMKPLLGYEAFDIVGHGLIVMLLEMGRISVVTQVLGMKLANLVHKQYVAGFGLR